MQRGWGSVSLDEVRMDEEGPGTRWETSTKRDGTASYHSHEARAEPFRVVQSRCRIETERDSFVPAEPVHFGPGGPLSPNDSCELIDVGNRPESRRPAHRVQSDEERRSVVRIDDPSTEA